MTFGAIIIPKAALERVKAFAHDLVLTGGVSVAIQSKYEGYVDGIATCMGADAYALLAGYFERERELAKLEKSTVPEE
jgi:hypothetical protein